MPEGESAHGRIKFEGKILEVTPLLYMGDGTLTALPPTAYAGCTGIPGSGNGPRYIADHFGRVGNFVCYSCEDGCKGEAVNATIFKRVFLDIVAFTVGWMIGEAIHGSTLRKDVRWTDSGTVSNF